MKTTQINNEKYCSKCSTFKLLEEFQKIDIRSKSYLRYKNGIRPWCKKCTKLYMKQYASNNSNPTHKSFSYYYKKYGLTLEEVVSMHEQRNNKCDICGEITDFRYDKLCIDHCHNTGKIRGLLCFSCNIMIGNAKDNKTILQNAIHYLEKNS